MPPSFNRLRASRLAYAAASAGMLLALGGYMPPCVAEPARPRTPAPFTDTPNPNRAKTRNRKQQKGRRR